MGDTHNVLITGFGPFRDHKINASWEAVKKLENYKLSGHTLITKELAVSYDHIDRNVPELWKIYKPKLVIHVGVSHLTNELKVEKRAYRDGYSQKDCNAISHTTGAVCDETDGEDCIQTALDVENICKYVTETTNINCTPSVDAGRYLCEYTYYTSLKINPEKTLFVHVPMLDQPYSSEQVALAIFHIIKGGIRYCECKDSQ